MIFYVKICTLILFFFSYNVLACNKTDSQNKDSLNQSQYLKKSCTHSQKNKSDACSKKTHKHYSKNLKTK